MVVVSARRSVVVVVVVVMVVQMVGEVAMTSKTGQPGKPTRAIIPGIREYSFCIVLYVLYLNLVYS